MNTITKMSLHELLAELENKRLTSVEIVQAYKANFEADAREKLPLNGFIEFFDDALEKATEADKARSEGAKKPLLGLPIAIKDNISVKGKLCTCCSKILEGYIAPYHATVTERLLDAGAVLLGRTNMDEFAMGASTEFSCYGPSRNPYDRSKTPGGSSGGSAAVVAGDQAPAALGTETGGSVRLPAAYCGLFGLKPTYGLFSRYGVTAYSSTVDQVGVFTRTVADMALLTAVLAGKDPHDLTSAAVDFSHFAELQPYSKEDVSKMKFLLFKEFVEADGVSPAMKEAFEQMIARIRATGAVIETVSFPMLKVTGAEYSALTFPDAASNLSRFDGIRYGARIDEGKGYDDLYIKTRSEKIGVEAKRRILIGNYILTQEFAGDIYQVGQKFQFLFEQKIAELMNRYDIILCPTSPTTAFKLGEKVQDPKAMYLSDLFTNFANIAKIPSLSVPVGISSQDGMPIGMQFASGQFCEEKILRLALAWERGNI